MEDLQKQLKSLKIDADLKDYLNNLTTIIHQQSDYITDLQNEVQYLRKKVNDVERYTSKDTIIFRNLPLLSNKNVTTDVIEFLRRIMGIEITPAELVACHELSPIKNPNEPPPIIAKFIQFHTKNRIFGRKKFLVNFRNPKNGKPVFLEERLTSDDRDLMAYANSKNLRTCTFNSQPQILINEANGVVPHVIVDKTDIDELMEQGKAVKKVEKIGAPQPVVSSTVFQGPSMPVATPRMPRRKHDEIKTPPTANSDSSLISQLSDLANDEKALMDFVRGLLQGSPKAKQLRPGNPLTSNENNCLQ